MSDGFDCLTFQAPLDVSLRFLSHGWPPVIPSDQNLGLPYSRMTRCRSIMICFEYLLTNGVWRGDNQGFLPHPHSFVSLIHGILLLPFYHQGGMLCLLPPYFGI